MAIGKETRQAVYSKYNGRCAYCGREIAYKDMQVDHFVAKRGWNESGSDDISNLMPSCRMCNHYKRANTIETFRRYIEEIPRKLRENYIYKVGIVYGNVLENKKPIVFFFEKESKEKPMTNADRIRAMSDEDLAETIHAVGLGWKCSTNGWCDFHCKYPGEDGCYKCILKWLQQPAGGAEDG